MAAPFTSALYYPHIDIRNERWLRSATLFWDAIRTIVPASLRDPYSSVFARELNDEGILQPVRVSSDMDEVDSLTDTVLDFLTDPSSAEVILQADEHLTRHIHREKMSRELRELAEIHSEKLPYMIREHLDRTLNDEGWYRVEPGFANFYMTLLASRLSERLGLGLITESSAADQLAIAVSRGKPIRSGDDRAFGYRRLGRDYEAAGPRRVFPTEVAPCLLLDLVVQSIELPTHIGAKDILNFKRAHREELAIFRREVHRLTADLPKEASIEALRQYVHDQYETEVIPALRSLRQSLKAQGWNSALNGFLKVSFFSATPTSAAILAGLPASVALLAGVGVSLTASVALLVNERKQAKLDNPYSYLLSLEHRW